jgi:hypothetical protein
VSSEEYKLQSFWTLLFLFVLHGAKHATECTRLNLLHFVMLSISYCDSLYYRAVYGEVVERTVEQIHKQTHTQSRGGFSFVLQNKAS